MSKRIVLGAVLAFASVSAFAGSADVCYTTPETGQLKPITASTPLACPIAGNHSIVDLAKADWSIVSVTAVMAPSPAQPVMTWMVVIQKPGK